MIHKGSRKPKYSNYPKQQQTAEWMGEGMEYQGLTQDDLVNVRALNRAWLARLAPREALPSTPRRLERLANTPFLLFTFREDDAGLWGSLLGDAPQSDLFSGRVVSEVQELQSAGLGFLWALARRNPYVARIVSGAPLNWCDQLASQTLVRVHECAASAELLEPRFAKDSPVLRRLLFHGSGALREARRSAQLAALQAMLTLGESARLGRLPAAACRMPAVPTRVADKL
jgi:hypothetical protein